MILDLSFHYQVNKCYIKKFGTKLTSVVNNLLDSSQIPFLLDAFRKELRTDKVIFSTIAYDSATVDPEKSGKKILFVFNMQTFDGRIKSKVLHLLQKSENRIDEEIKDIIQRIVEESLKHNIHFT